MKLLKTFNDDLNVLVILALHHDLVRAPCPLRYRRHRLQDPLVPLDCGQAPTNFHDGKTWSFCLNNESLYLASV